ncbi:GINS complex Sld5 component [Cantharellus anzutake]|uniref:GINS complex Sld5 component n=1 Tax=Cantharellus anzutake TaxID=1750568 RepID=UPI001906BE58|nr:GINS complex Sld5 component [Cantharellus anzutake]KAF8337347.1 GINS complex Sld5 component [Cantharellus anzutake]
MDIDDHISNRAATSHRRDGGSPPDELNQILRAGSTTGPEIDVFGRAEEEEEGVLDRLTRLWMDERSAPDILLWPGLMVEEVLDKLQAQSEMVEHLQSDPRTSEEEHFRIVLIQTEAERVRYLLRSYLRTRLYKVEKYAAHIIATPDLRGRLSVIELSHAERYQEMLKKHFEVCALNGIPENLRSLTDNEPGVPEMVTRPNLDQPVFVRAKKRCQPVTLTNGSTLEMERGDIHLVRYRAIEHLVRLGDAHLI